MTKNILYLIERLGPGGTEKQLVALIRGLNQREFIPHLCTLRPSIGFYDELEIPKLSLNITRLANYATVHAMRRLTSFCRIYHIDLIQTFFQDPTLIGAALKAILPVKLIGSFRDMGFWRTPVESMKMRIAYPMFDGFIANSQAVKTHYCSSDHLQSQKVEVIYNGFHTFPQEKRKYEKRQEGFNVGIVGNFNRQVKRTQDFIKLSAIVTKELPNTRFTLVGGGGQEKLLRQMANDLGTAGKTWFVGMVDDAMPYIETFDVGVNTSATEGFSNAVIEYMAAGLPVVATDVGGNRELVENRSNGFLFSVGNVEQAATSIIELLRDRQLCERIGAANRKKIANQFKYEKMIQRHQAYYRKIISET